MTNRKMNFDKFRIQTQPATAIKKIIAVMSGKGGVGKSSISSPFEVDETFAVEVAVFTEFKL